jgi:hypothetical protein
MVSWGMVRVYAGVATVVLALAVYFSGWDKHESRVSEDMARSVAAHFIPKTVRGGVTIESVGIRFDNAADLLIGMQITKLHRTYNMVIHTVGQPDITHVHNGEVHFKADTVEIVSFDHTGKVSTADLLRQGAQRYITNEGLRNAVTDAAPHVEDWMKTAAQDAALLALQNIPIYKLKNDVKGTFIGAAVQSAEIRGNELIIHWSLFKFAEIVIATIVLGAICLAIFIGALFL